MTASDPKTRPIPMTADSVRAILAGTKTQTRRVLSAFREDPGCAQLLQFSDGAATFGHSIPDDPVPLELRCPYGVRGDRLWVRETWGYEVASEPAERAVVYRATVTDPPGWPGRRGPYADWVVWKSPRFMPRWASRLLLEVTSVRVERLHQITSEDARAEGVPAFSTSAWNGHRLGFAHAWDAINKHRAPWARNPWVWVLDFRLIEAARSAA